MPKNNSKYLIVLKGISKNLTPITKLLVIMCVILASFIVINCIGILLSLPVFRINYLSFQYILRSINYNNHFHINILKYLQIWQTVGLFIIPPLVIGYLLSDKPLDYLRLKTYDLRLISIFFTVLIVFSSMPVIEWMVDVNSRLFLPHQFKAIEQWMKNSEIEAEIITKAFLNVTTSKGLLVNLMMIAILPAIGEELFFRGFLVRFIKDWTKKTHLAIWLSAIIFSLIHFQFYGFIPRMLLGALFGYLFVWSGTIWVPVIAHFINNGTAVIGSYLQSKGLIKTDIDKIFSPQSNYFFLLMSIIITAVFIYLFYYWEKRKLKN